MAAVADFVECDDDVAVTEDDRDPPDASAPSELRFVGRTDELQRALDGLRMGHSVLLKGPAGIGKRALLREVRRQLAGERICLWPTLSTPKQFVTDLAEQVHHAIGLEVPERLVPPRFRAAAHRTGTVAWRHIQRTISRQPAQEIVLLVLNALAERRDVVLFVESMEIPPTQADLLHQLAESCQVAASIEEANRRNKIVRLLWRFQVTIELKPLLGSESRALIETWLTRHPIEFDPPRVRDAFVTRVARESRGIPAAITGMLNAAATEREVTRHTLSAYRHDAAITYIDMTPLLLVVVMVLMALRYISRGIDVQELMVLAGVGTSLFSLMLFFARRMSIPSR